jgi:hypothetical protein
MVAVGGNMEDYLQAKLHNEVLANRHVLAETPKLFRQSLQ